MNNSKNNIDGQKKAIFDNMSQKRQKYILKKGYDKWDPFQEPKDPIDIRVDKTKRTTQMLVREFLQSKNSNQHPDDKSCQYSNSYGQGVLELCLGIINNDERHIGMYEFSCWYRDLLEKEKIIF